MPDATGPNLHDRRTRGQTLSDEEQVILQRWYEDQDQMEDDLLQQARRVDIPREPHSRLLDLMSQLEVVSRHIREVAAANEQLRAMTRERTW